MPKSVATRLKAVESLPNMPKIIAFSGESNSGKTTLICKLCAYFRENLALKVAVIKHDPKDKAIFDSPSKDSAKFFAISNAVAVISPTRLTMQIHNEIALNAQNTQDLNVESNRLDMNAESHGFDMSLESRAQSLNAESSTQDLNTETQGLDLNAESHAFKRALEAFSEYDMIFIEGLKYLPYPRLVIARNRINKAYIPYAQAFCVDRSVENVAILPPNMPVLDLNDTAQIAAFICEFCRIEAKN